MQRRRATAYCGASERAARKGDDHASTAALGQLALLTAEHAAARRAEEAEQRERAGTMRVAVDKLSTNLDDAMLELARTRPRGSNPSAPVPSARPSVPRRPQARPLPLARLTCVR